MKYRILTKAFLIYCYACFMFLAFLGYMSNGWLGVIPGGLGMAFVIGLFLSGKLLFGPGADL